MKTLCIILGLLSLSLLPTTRGVCAPITLGTESFDLCPFATITPFLSLDTVIDGTISYSIGEPTVPNCGTGSTMIWSKLEDGLGDCFDVAIAPPDVTLLDPTNAKTGGLRILYPANNDFQLEILLYCAPKQLTMTDKTFTLTKMFGQGSTGVTTYTISGNSDHGCAVYTSTDCPPQRIGNGNYELCALNTTLPFNLTDPLGGHLAFNLGGTPKIQGCSWPHEADFIYGNYYANSGECFSAASTVGPTITPLVYWNPDGGLLIEYHYPYSTMRNLILQIKLKLLCNPDEDDITLLTPTIDVTYTEWYLTFDLLAESAYACSV